MSENMILFFIGFLTALFVVGAVWVIKRHIEKSEERLIVTTFIDSKTYKLTLVTPDHSKGRYFNFETKEELIKKLKKYPDNTYVELDKSRMCIQDMKVTLPTL